MVKLELPKDFAEHIGKALGWKMNVVNEAFEFEETKDGYFIAQLKKGRSLSKTDFKTVCSLARDLGGEYVQGKGKWAIPGPYAEKGVPEPSPQPQPGVTTPPVTQQGVVPHVVSMDQSKPTYITLPIKALLSMPFQSRTTEDPELEELAESIKTYGVLEPILVRPKPGGLYEIVAGERRVKAAEKAGLADVPTIIKWLNDKEAYEIQLAENINRKDLADIEKARALKHLIDKFGYTQEQIAKKYGKTQTWVARHLAMLDIVRDIIPRGIKPEAFTERQAREFLAAPPEKREEILKEIAETGEVPSSREIRRAVQPEPTTAYPPLPSEPTTAGSPEKLPVKVPEPKPEPLLTGFEVECPECHKKILINHKEYPDGKIIHEVED